MMFAEDSAVREDLRVHGSIWSLPATGRCALRTVVVTGGSLFQIASHYLGDATQWIRVAQLNGLSDPMLQGLVSLRLPEADATAGGGIVQQ